jgi:hypothetical protein
MVGSAPELRKQDSSELVPTWRSSASRRGLLLREDVCTRNSERKPPSEQFYVKVREPYMA